MKQTDPRKIPMGTCGHKIQAVQYDGKMRWWCEEEKSYDTKFKETQFVQRGKAK